MWDCRFDDGKIRGPTPHEAYVCHVTPTPTPGYQQAQIHAGWKLPLFLQDFCKLKYKYAFLAYYHKT